MRTFAFVVLCWGLSLHSFLNAQSECSDASACNFGLPSAASGCLYPTDLFEDGEFKDCTGRVLDVHDLNQNGLPDILETTGCKNPKACNYNPEATRAGDCDFASCVGCMDTAAWNYSPEATRTDDSCIVGGCTDDASPDYNPEAIVDDGSCRYYNCYDPSACNARPFGKPGVYISIACDYSCVGCRDEAACNYGPTKTIHDGTICNYDCLSNTAHPDGTGSGCATPEACNYTAGLAVHLPGACLFPTCKDSTACNYDAAPGCQHPELCTFALDKFPTGEFGCDGHCLADEDEDSVCDHLEVPGCMDASACNFNPAATDDDGSCHHNCAVCRDFYACNYVSAGLSHPDACSYDCGGCTKTNACNYDPTAAYNDGSCRFIHAIVEIDPWELPLEGGWDLACHDDSASAVFAHLYGPMAGDAEWVWADGQTANPASQLPAGTHNLQVTYPSCSATIPVQVRAPLPLTLTPLQTNAILCHGGTDGAIIANAAGGTAPYQWSWESGDSTAVRSGLAAGQHPATVTDANGCTTTESILLGEPSALSISIDAPQTISCAGGQSGIVEAAPAGGTPPYSFAWNTGSTGSSIGALSTGTYTVTVTDANGCNASEATTLVDGGSDLGVLPQIGIKALHQPTCLGETGSVVIDTSHSVTPIQSITWSHPTLENASRDRATDLAPGEYLVTARAPSGCESALSITIQSPPTFERLNVRSWAATHPTNPTGKITFDLLGPSSTYEVIILPSDTLFTPRWIQFDNRLKASDDPLGLSPGAYTLHSLRDVNTGCLGADAAPDVAIVPHLRGGQTNPE